MTILPGRVPAGAGIFARSSWRYWLRNRWQALLLLLGMSMGVAVVYAVDIANQSATRAFALSLDAVTGRTTHQIVAAGGLPESLYTRLRVELGERASAPVVAGSVTVRGETLQLLGFDLFAEPAFRGAATTADGRGETGGDDAGRAALLLLQPGTASMAARTAQRMQLRVGDTFVAARGGVEHQLKLVRLLHGDRQAAMETILFVDVATAQDLLDMHGRLSRIDLILDDDAHLQRLSVALPDVTIIDAARRDASLQQMSSAFHTNLFAMGLLALLVGAFLIYNTVTLSVLHRRHTFGLLRLLGVSRRQLTCSILVEVAAFATLAIGFGLVVGYLLGTFLLALMARTLSDLYFAQGVQQLQFDGFSLARAVALGFASALLAALAPAAEAARSVPVNVLQRSVIERRTRTLVPALALGGALLVACGGLITWLSDRNLWAGFAALFCVVFGAALMVPMVLSALVAGVERLLPANGSALGRYPLRSLPANLSRTSVAIASLAVAVSATAGVGIMIGSFRVSVQQWLQHTLEADIYISEASGGDGFGPALREQLLQLPGVAEITMARFATVETGSGPVRLLAVSNSESLSRRFVLRDSIGDEVYRRFGSTDSVWISEPYSWKTGLGPGDRIALVSARGQRDFLVTGVFQDFRAGPGLLVMDRQRYQRYWQDDRLSSLGVYLHESAGDGVVAQLRERVAADSSALMLRSNVEIRENSLEIFDQTFAITQVLRLLTVIVAFVGILSATIAQTLERAREFAVLRALGVTIGELRRLLLAQTALIGAIAGVLAIPLGVAMSLLLVKVVNRRSFGWTMDFYVPAGVLLETLLLALLAAMLAGIYPAWKMSRVQPADALRHV